MDATLWSWLAIAAMGALHGLNPLTGWGLATACSLHANDRSMPLRALLPMACGHLAAVALTAAAVVWRLSLSPSALLAVAGGLAGVVVLARAHLPAAVWHRLRKPAGPVGMALWSFGVATVHGAGLALVPALAPLCGGDVAAGGVASGGDRLSTPLLFALATLGVHTLAMLAVTGAMAAAACRGVQGAQRWLQRYRGCSGGPAR
ncbi:hypothetical protein [Acidovorax sp. Root402]|uniref:hypothetical protein n=1 Tax=Acidovorax sp. Root402 TaxID=1736527 RepID=UPI000700EE8B|nr:hypothetical protein [Acidovorax sp. Root402]KQW32463.1 hypothetical protein ASC83_00355 [Acidovorax sp. Root402]